MEHAATQGTHKTYRSHGAGSMVYPPAGVTIFTGCRSPGLLGADSSTYRSHRSRGPTDTLNPAVGTLLRARDYRPRSMSSANVGARSEKATTTQ